MCNPSDLLEVGVSDVEAGTRLDVFVSHLPGIGSRAEAQRLIEVEGDGPGGVRINGRRGKANMKVQASDVVTVSRPETAAAKALPEVIPLTVVYEDSELLVINKPRGMVVHPASGVHSGTLVNAVLAHADDLSGIGGEARPGIVHRLDKDTGGLLVVAKTDDAHRSLQAQIQAHTAQRRYMAVVWGIPGFRTAAIDAPIGRHPADRKKMAVITDPKQTSRHAHTDLTVMETFRNTFSLVEASLQTGRTHQIRVHCAYIKHPIVGDPIYGGLRKLGSPAFTSAERSAIEGAMEDLGGQALHAYSLAIDHPVSGERLEFAVELAPPVQRLLSLLRSAGT